MTESILDSVKAVCNLESDYTDFDDSILLFINAELAVLNQIGIGPVEGFSIEDASAVWDDFLEGEQRLNMVKSYLPLKVRMAFDPPTTGPLNTAMENICNMLFWRIREYREDKV